MGVSIKGNHIHKSLFTIFLIIETKKFVIYKLEIKTQNNNLQLDYDAATKKGHVNVGVLKQYPMCIMIFVSFIHLERINRNKIT